MGLGGIPASLSQSHSKDEVKEMEVTEEISIQDAIDSIAKYAGRCSRSTLYRWMAQLNTNPVGGYITHDDLVFLIIWAKAIYRIRDAKAAARAVHLIRSQYSPEQLSAFAYNPASTFTKSILKELSYAA